MTDEERDNKLLAWLDELGRDEWVSMVRYFAPQLLGNQTLLCDAITRGAGRRAERRNGMVNLASDVKTSAYYIVETLDHLGLRLAVKGEGTS